MNKAMIFKLALLVFVGLSLFWLIKDGARQATDSQVEPTAGEPSGIDADVPSQQVVVYYFHGTNRCPTCLKIEALAAQTVTTSFAAELSDGRVRWQALDFELPENKHFVDEYELYSQSLIVLRLADGKPVAWKNLTEIWELVGDQEAFSNYVQGEVKAYLGEV